jgi:apolipoprotein N-acyltransferase
MLRPLVAGLAHAALMVCAFPPVGLWPLALLAPLPLIWIALRGSTGPARSRPFLVATGVLPLWLYEQCWVIDVSLLGYPLLAIALALFAALFVWSLARIARRVRQRPSPARSITLALAIPTLWTGVEVLRGDVAFTGYPWMLLAHPLIDQPRLALPASLLGTYLVSFAAAAVAGCLATVLWGPEGSERGGGRARVWGGAVLGALAACIWVLTPLWVRRPLSTHPLRIAVIQTNLPQSNKIEWPVSDRLEAFRRWAALTEQAAAQKPDLIVWPETMFPGVALDPPVARRLEDVAPEGKLDPDTIALLPLYHEILALQQRIGVPLLIGAIGIEPGSEVRQYNSVFLIESGRVAPTRYDKLHLTPFGEVMPYIRYWPWLQRRLLALGARGMSFDLSPGSAPRLFTLATPSGPVSIGTPICFEATSADVCLRLARAAGGGPTVLINLTNDGWFGGFDPGRRQHLQAARWRALELGVPLVRAANTGISCTIDPRGRVLARIDGSGARIEGVLTCELAPAVPITIFTRAGYIFTWSVLVLACAAVLATFLPIRRKRSIP